MFKPNFRTQALSFSVGYILTSFIWIGVKSTCDKETAMCPVRDRDGYVVTSVFLWAKTDRVLVNECAADCYRDTGCHAFFYNNLSLVCQGYTSTALSSANAVPEVGWVHYQYCLHTDCTDAAFTGIFTVAPSDGLGNVHVFCNTETDGGGWLVFQRRTDGSVDFVRGWDDFKAGFGFLGNEFWLGNDYIHRLTNQRPYTLRIDLGDFEGVTCSSTFTEFLIASEDDKYQITVGGYAGQCGDSFTPTNGMYFSTFDRDNDNYDENCAVKYPGGWWFDVCLKSQLNGQYNNTIYASGVCWSAWKGFKYSLRFSEMMIRPA